MSAGSPRRAHSQTRTIQNSMVVSPQQVTDPTILDSVAGFINEVATYNVPCDTKDQIQWARFEQIDSDIVLENCEGEKVVPLSLVLILGYSTGIQVWAIPANGEAIEILSWRHGCVRVLRFLPAPAIMGQHALADLYGPKRPLIALCDSSGSQYCTLNFLSLKTGEQVKVIKFRNPVLDVLANRRSVVVTFSERIAVFDAFSLEDRLTVTTCYLSPGVHPNPIALGTRWIAYAEKKLIMNKRSGGGNEGEGVQSYTATVLHAAKSLGKGLRELGETVASSLTGNATFKPGSSPGSNNHMQGLAFDGIQKGIVTVLDIESPNPEDKTLQAEGVVAHFAAHSEAIVCLAFDPSGMLLLTADKRGHDFHLFRIHPHPGGPSLSAVHHLYVLHRGDTTARVQDICFSPDSRWAAVSTLRGTTHVFPITPYGGNVGMRTHATPHVVNRMSRFHRSAGLPAEGRCNSPVSLFEAPLNSGLPYNNPRIPPYPHPTTVHPLAQIRQPLFVQGPTSQSRPHATRPRLNSSSEDNSQVALRVCACFAPARAWLDTATPAQDIPLNKQQVKAVVSLFVMSGYGNLVQYDLEPHHTVTVSKEKVCDETPVELEVTAKAQWSLQRQPQSVDVSLPLSEKVLNLLPHNLPLFREKRRDQTEDGWLSQVEIVTHAGPHRRLWMGPQFTFKTYTIGSGSLSDAQAIDVGRSKPVSMPVSTTYPILIESSSVSSCEQSPKLMEGCHRFPAELSNVGVGETQLKEDLADAMMESPGVRDTGGRCVIVSMKGPHPGVVTKVAKVVNPLGTVVTVHSDEDFDPEPPEEAVIHENCDEALFRPIVTPKPARKFTTTQKQVAPSRSPIPTTKQDPKSQNAKSESVDKQPPSPQIPMIANREQESKSKVQNKSKGAKGVRAKYQTKCEIKIITPSPDPDENIKNSLTTEQSEIEEAKTYEEIEKVKVPLERLKSKTSVKIQLETAGTKKIKESNKVESGEIAVDTLKSDSSTIVETAQTEDLVSQFSCSKLETSNDKIQTCERAKKEVTTKIQTSNKRKGKKVPEPRKCESDIEELDSVDEKKAKQVVVDDIKQSLDEAFAPIECSRETFHGDMIKFEDSSETFLLIESNIDENCRSGRQTKNDQDKNPEMLECMDVKKNADEMKSDLKIEDAISSEEEKVIRPRKSKTKQKLGAKLNWGKEEKELYWKSVFSTESEDSKQKVDVTPKMSYSTAAKRNLQDEQILAESSSSDENLVGKAEKQDTSSSPVETTESDDDKGIAMDTEEDGYQPKTVSTETNPSKSKKKPKKKKR